LDYILGHIKYAHVDVLILPSPGCRYILSRKSPCSIVACQSATFRSRRVVIPPMLRLEPHVHPGVGLSQAHPSSLAAVHPFHYGEVPFSSRPDHDRVSRELLLNGIGGIENVQTLVGLVSINQRYRTKVVRRVC
jgi:hypothetical protein